jgi:hypothetical protein
MIWRMKRHEIAVFAWRGPASLAGERALLLCRPGEKETQPEAGQQLDEPGKGRDGAGVGRAGIKPHEKKIHGLKVEAMRQSTMAGMSKIDPAGEPKGIRDSSGVCSRDWLLPFRRFSPADGDHGEDGIAPHGCQGQSGDQG